MIIHIHTHAHTLTHTHKNTHIDTGGNPGIYIVAQNIYKKLTHTNAHTNKSHD